MLVSSTLYSVFLSCWCWSDSESLPSLEVLQNGLLNTNDEDVEEVVTLYLHLLRFALDDLGVPNPRSVSSFSVCMSANIQLLFLSVCLQVFIFSQVFAAHSCCLNIWKSSNPALRVVSLPICLSVGQLAIRLFQIKALKQVQKCAKQQ